MKEYNTRKQALEFYRDTISEAAKLGPEQKKLAVEKIGRHDLYFLLTVILDRYDDFNYGSEARKDWIFCRCREVQLAPNGYLDLWARFHYKTSIITCGLTTQDILNDPEVTIAIFSFNNKAAKEPYTVIKRYLEYMGGLGLYQDVLWPEPWKESQRWTIDEGLIVKREGNPRESTLNSFGLVDSQPIGSHFKIRVYDDVVTPAEVSNPDMIRKAISQWELSLNLTSNLPVKHYGYGNISRYVGTRYHFNDPYKTIMDRNAAHPWLLPATDDGTVTGEPVFLTQGEFDKFRREQGPYTTACQLLLNPVADDVQGFKYEWIEWNEKPAKGWWQDLNRYIIVDPATEKKRTSDNTAILVIGMGEDQHYYLIDGVRDRLNLTERTAKLIQFHRMYKPLLVGYEKYGKDSDIEHIKFVQNQQNYRFGIIPLGGVTSKEDRIRRLVPIFESRRFVLPVFLHFIDYQGRQRDLVREFVNDEYLAFPYSTNDDVLDCMARIVDESDANLRKGWQPLFPDSGGFGGYDSEVLNTDYDVLNYW